MGFGICLVRDYYNNYRNLTQGTHYYIQEDLSLLSKRVKNAKLGNSSRFDLLKIKLLLQDLQSANAQYTSILSSMRLDLIDALD